MEYIEQAELKARRELVTYLAQAHPTVEAMRGIWRAAGGKVEYMPDDGSSAYDRWQRVVVEAQAGALNLGQFAAAIRAAHPGSPDAALIGLGWEQ